MRTVTQIDKVGYSYSSYGSCSEVVVFRIDFDPDTGSRFSQIRDVLRKLDREIGMMSHDEHVYSAYDCTGRPFGSRWRRLDSSESEDGIAFVYIHGWGIDI